MSDKMIIFDGTNDHEIEIESMYDNPYILSLTSDEANEVYNFTSAYAKLIEHRNTVYSNKVSMGSMMMGIMIDDFKYIEQRKLITKTSKP